MKTKAKVKPWRENTWEKFLEKHVLLDPEKAVNKLTVQNVTQHILSLEGYSLV